MNPVECIEIILILCDIASTLNDIITMVTEVWPVVRWCLDRWPRRRALRNQADK